MQPGRFGRVRTLLEKVGKASTRKRGVSLIRPSHAQATVHITEPSGLLGVGVAGLSNVDIHGSAVEPEFQLTNDAYDVAAAGYTGTGSPALFSAIKKTRRSTMPARIGSSSAKRRR